MTFRAYMAKKIQIFGTFKVIDHEPNYLYQLANKSSITGESCPKNELGHATTHSIMDVNILDRMMIMRKAIRHISTAHVSLGGVINNISYIALRLISPSEYVHYAAFKRAVNAMLSVIVDTKKHANKLRLSHFAEPDTSTPMGCGSNSNEIEDAVMCLLDKKNAFTNGACILMPGRN